MFSVLLEIMKSRSLLLCTCFYYSPNVVSYNMQHISYKPENYQVVSRSGNDQVVGYWHRSLTQRATDMALGCHLYVHHSNPPGTFALGSLF